MARAKAEITISHIIDIESVTRYYLLQSSTLAAPIKPSTYPPATSWKLTEPSYTTGSTNTLYFVDCTVFTNKTFKYSNVSKSSSYEAAKEAYNKATNAQSSANSANNKIDSLKIGGRNYFGTRNVDYDGDGRNGLSFDKNNEYTLATYQDKGSFSQFYNLTIPMSEFVGEKIKMSFDIISPNGDTSCLVYNTNGTPRYAMTINNSIQAVGTTWVHQELDITVADKGEEGTDLISSNKIEIYCPTQVGCKIRNVKFELGNKATDWTPAPEDLASSNGLEAAENAAQDAADKLSERIEQAESRISQIADSISTMVIDGSGASLMEQTSSGWIFSMGETLTQLQNAIDGIKSLENDIDAQGGDITALENAVTGLEKLTSYIRITTDGDEPCIELGNESSFKVLITNTSIKFMDGTTVPAYVTNQSLKIGKAEVEDELAFGGFAFAERSNGNMGLIWKGSDS